MKYARDELLASRSTYATYLPQSSLDSCRDCLAGVVTTLKRVQTKEFENWIVRIVLEGAGCEARNASKSLTIKFQEYVGSENGGGAKDKNVSAKQVLPLLWSLAKPLIGDEGPTAKDAKQPSKAKASSSKASKS